MKLAVLFSLIAMSHLSFAFDLNSVDLNSLQKDVKSKLNETRNMEAGMGYCDFIENNQVQCTWYIEDTGRTPDSMIGIFNLVNEKLELVSAYEEYGC